MYYGYMFFKLDTDIYPIKNPAHLCTNITQTSLNTIFFLRLDFNMCIFD